MNRLLTLLLTLTAMLLSTAAAEITPIWSANVAVPGEKVVLYLIDPNIGEDIFLVRQRPDVERAQLEMLQPQAGVNPNDPDRRTAEVYPILITPDQPGDLQIPDIEVEYKSGRRETISIPVLPVLPTSDIKWENSPIPFGVLWHTDVKDGYVDQPIRTAIKLFLPGSVEAPLPPQLNSVGVKVSPFAPAVQGVAALAHNSIGNSTALARGQRWNTVNFNGTLTPFREGNADVAGKQLLIVRRGFFNTERLEATLPMLAVSALPLPPGAPANYAHAVGHFSIHATTTAKSLAMNEPVEVEITVRGSHIPENMECPNPENAAEWKLIPATRKPIIGPNGETEGMVFTRLIRPTAEVGGIPAFSFGYYDPTGRNYRQAATAPIPLIWQKSDTAGVAIVASQSAEPPPAGDVPTEEMTDIYGYLPEDIAGSIHSLPRGVVYLLYLPAVGIALWLLIAHLRRRIAAGSADRARDRELDKLAKEADGLAFLRHLGSFIETNIPPAAMTPDLQEILQTRDREAFRPDAQTSLSEPQRSSMIRSVRKALAGLAGSVMLLLLALMPAAHGAETAGAEQAYHAGQYSQAIELLEKRLPGADNPAAISYNIGNCQYRLGKPGLAALWYARALQADPGMKEARANLAFIQRKEGAILPIGSTTDDLFTLLSVPQLWLATIICTAAFALGAVLLLISRNGWLRAGTILAAVLSLLCALDWVYYTTRETPHISALPPADLAYVLQKAPLRNAANAEGTSLLTLTPSTPLHLLATRGSWAYVETLTGQTRGWVESTHISPLDPTCPPSTPLLLRF